MSKPDTFFANENKTEIITNLINKCEDVITETKEAEKDVDVLIINTAIDMAS